MTALAIGTGIAVALFVFDVGEAENDCIQLITSFIALCYPWSHFNVPKKSFINVDGWN